MKPQDEIKNLKQQIEEQEGEIKNLKQQIEEQEDEIDRLEKQIIEINEEQDERDACLPELVHEALRRVAGFEGDPWATAPSLWVRDLELALFAEISR